jgi:hypothetical protein
MRARLVPPYFVELSNAKPLMPQDREKMNALLKFYRGTWGPTTSSWLRFVRELRERYEN